MIMCYIGVRRKWCTTWKKVETLNNSMRIFIFVFVKYLSNVKTKFKTLSSLVCTTEPFECFNPNDKQCFSQIYFFR